MHHYSYLVDSFEIKVKKLNDEYRRIKRKQKKDI